MTEQTTQQQAQSRYDDSEKGRRRRERAALDTRKHLSRLNDVAIPRVRSYSRRARCRADLRRFALTYGRAAFPLPFSDDHGRVIQHLQEAILTGGRFALAMPRGSGKTTLIIWAIIWAVCFGHRRYVVLIACDLDAAKQIMDACKAQFEANPLLFADFPELCAPARMVEGVPQRAVRVHVGDRPLHMVWSSKRVVCPDVKGAACAGVKVEAYGLDGRLRGAFVQRADGTIERPDFAVLDDPQKDKHARSSTEVDKREQIIKGTVLGLAGPGRRIAACCPCTVIAPNDLADRLLSSDLNPEWQSVRTRMVYHWPDAQTTLWSEYAQLRREAQLRGEPSAPDALAFYRDHRAEMDAGAKVGWEHRMHEGELSAIQHAENLLLDVGEAAFEAEYNNAPLSGLSAPYELTARHVLAALNGYGPRVLPSRVTILVGFIDINRYGLNWTVCGARRDRCLYVVDYGKHPPGDRRLFQGDGSDSGTEEQVIRRGLEELGQAIVIGRQYLLEDAGRARRFDVLMVDCAYAGVGGGLDRAVYDFAQHARLSVTILPARGFSARVYRPNQKHGRVGDGWHESESPGKGRFLAFNADVWRAASQKAWLQPVGSAGSVSLFGRTPGPHAIFAEQCSRERLLGIEPRGTYDAYLWDEQGHEWHDLGDCITGCHVAASYMGADVVTGGLPRWQPRSALPRRVSKVKPE